MLARLLAAACITLTLAAALPFRPVSATPASAGTVSSTPDPAAESFRVLTLNLRLDGEDRLPALIDLIRQTRADVVGLQECGASARPIAHALGFNLAKQDDDRAIVSRFPILGLTPRKQGVYVKTPSGATVAVFNAHLYFAPYQPYQLLRIPYMDAAYLSSAEEAVAAAEKARGADVKTMLADVYAVDPAVPMIVTGDFNEPSHLDWTARAARARRHPLEVPWPSTTAFAKAGFIDTWRALHPDELADPGFTWTPDTSQTDPHDHPDRLDFVLVRGEPLCPVRVDVVGEDAVHAQLVVSPYPTDHRAVLATFEMRLPSAGTSGRGGSPSQPPR